MSLFSTRNGRMDAAAETVDVGTLYGLELQAMVAPHLEVQARVASGSAQGSGRWDIKDACGCTVTRQDTWVQRTHTADLGLNVYLSQPTASFQPYAGIRVGVAQTHMKSHQGVWSYGDLQSYPDGKAVNTFVGYQAGLKYQHQNSGWYGRLEVSGTTDLRSYSGFSQDNVRLGLEGLSPRALTLSVGRSFGGRKPAPKPAPL
jgi:opacity protein-like surface antigen